MIINVNELNMKKLLITVDTKIIRTNWHCYIFSLSFQKWGELKEKGVKSFLKQEL